MASRMQRGIVKAVVDSRRESQLTVVGSRFPVSGDRRCLRPTASGLPSSRVVRGDRILYCPRCGPDQPRKGTFSTMGKAFRASATIQTAISQASELRKRGSNSSPSPSWGGLCQKRGKKAREKGKRKSDKAKGRILSWRPGARRSGPHGANSHDKCNRNRRATSGAESAKSG